MGLGAEYRANEEGSRIERSRIPTMEARDFLLALDASFRHALIEDFAVYLITRRVSKTLGDELRASLVDDSLFIPLPTGGWEFMEKVPLAILSGNAFDRYLLRCPWRRAYVDAFRMITTKVPETSGHVDEVRLWSLRSGTGVEIFRMLENSAILKGRSEIICFDGDREAVSLGQTKAAALGLSDLVTFVHRDYKRLNGTANFPAPDVVLLTDVICTATQGQSARLLKDLKKYFKGGTVLVFNAVTDRMFRDDPFSCYILDLVLGLMFFHKTEAECREIVKTAGYISEGILRADPAGFYGLVRCRVP